MIAAEGAIQGRIHNEQKYISCATVLTENVSKLKHLSSSRVISSVVSREEARLNDFVAKRQMPETATSLIYGVMEYV